MAQVRRVVAMVIVASIAVFASGHSPTAASPARAPLQTWAPNEEAAFVAKINNLRSSKGLAPLAVDAELTEQSRRWAEQMRLADKISHAPDASVGVTSDWALIGENVGVGGDVDALFQAFVDSPTHYANLIDPNYRFVGVGVVWAGNKMFTTHRFMSLRPPAPAPVPRPTQPAPSPAPTQAPPTTAAPVEIPPPPPVEVPVEPVLVVPPADPQRIELVAASLGSLLDG